MSESNGATAGNGSSGDHHIRKVGFRPARREDIIDYYGELPKQTIRAYMLTLDGEIAGIVGLANDGAASRLFSEYRDELEPYLRSMTVLRCIKQAMTLVEKHAGIVYSMARDEVGAKLLTRLGFEDHGDYFLWQN